MAAPTIHVILTRHFLRRFFENDLISPESDRAQLMALVGATCFCSTLFITVVVSCFKYVIGTFTAGQAAVAALDDKFLYIGLSMVVSALLAASQWDALGLEPRDAAILGPLPLPASAIRRAKLSAVALLGGGAALLLNAAPTVLFPALLVAKQKVSVIALATVVVTHAAVTISAAIFGYLCVIALREGAGALLGHQLFGRVSSFLQTALVVGLGSALLLLPAASARVESRALAVSTAASPIAWFLGAYETLAGHVLADAPHAAGTFRFVEADRVARARYATHREQFGALASNAALGLATVLAVTWVAHLWSSRRAAQLAPPAAVQSYRRTRLSRALRRLIAGRHSATRAGFHFTLAAMWRSRAHRLAFAGAVAIATALTAAALSGLDLQQVVGTGRAPARLLVAQPLLYGALLIAFRHAIRVPASLQANWGFQVSWRGETTRYLSGARRAAIVSLIVPSLLIVFLFVASIAGARLAAAHALLGFAGALLVLEVLLLNYRKVPFTCALVPDETLKGLVPIYVILFFVGVLMFSRRQSAALVSLTATVTFALQLFAALVFLRLLQRWQRPFGPVEFDAAPEGAQELGLHG